MEAGFETNDSDVTFLASEREVRARYRRAIARQTRQFGFVCLNGLRLCGDTAFGKRQIALKIRKPLRICRNDGRIRNWQPAKIVERRHRRRHCAQSRGNGIDLGGERHFIPQQSLGLRRDVTESFKPLTQMTGVYDMDALVLRYVFVTLLLELCALYTRLVDRALNDTPLLQKIAGLRQRHVIRQHLEDIGMR